MTEKSCATCHTPAGKKCCTDCMAGPTPYKYWQADPLTAIELKIQQRLERWDHYPNVVHEMDIVKEWIKEIRAQN